MLLLCLALAGCGTSSATSTRSSTQSSGNYLTDQSSVIDTTVEGLHIHSDGLSCDHAFVLASTRLSYDAAEIQGMRAYASTIIGPHRGKLPPTFQMVNIGGGCSADLQITNTGKSTVEITRAGVKLLAAPTPNTYQYHFVDICTLTANCRAGFGGGPTCGVFTANAKLTAKTAGALAETTLDPGSIMSQPCPAERPLKHGDSIEVLLNLLPMTSTISLAYSIVPVLTIKTSSGQQVVPVTQARSWIVFTNPAQYACYGLHGHAFTVEKHGADAINRGDNGTIGGCM